MREQAILTNATCVYPRCTRPSRTADLDHLDEYDGTNTVSANLAPLCRGHHRYKTHAGWDITRTGPTTFTWTTPYGYSYDWDTSTPAHPTYPLRSPRRHRRRGHRHERVELSHVRVAVGTADDFSKRPRPVTASDYDRFAAAYSAENESGLFNAHYERPRCSSSPGTSQVAGFSTRDAAPGR